VLIVHPSEVADFRMDIYNADGGRVEMCGNGIRCFAKYVRDVGLTTKSEIRVETLAGIIVPRVIEKHARQTEDTLWVEVDMGAPILEAEKIPTAATGQVLARPFYLDFPDPRPEDPDKVTMTCVSMGNPHAVVFVNDIENYPVERVGRLIENHAFFPKRTNVEFVQVKSQTHVVQRTWERGSGETLACGTGASAVCVAGVLNELTGREITVSLKGGDLELKWDQKTNHVFKTGPATTVFDGSLPIKGDYKDQFASQLARLKRT
jgi:diaminopimelate epimerase